MNNVEFVEFVYDELTQLTLEQIQTHGWLIMSYLISYRKETGLTIVEAWDIVDNISLSYFEAEISFDSDFETSAKFIMNRNAGLSLKERLELL